MAVRARTHLVNKSGQSLKKNLLYQASDLGMLLRLALPTEGSISIWVQGSGLGFRAGSRRGCSIQVLSDFGFYTGYYRRSCCRVWVEDLGV